MKCLKKVVKRPFRPLTEWYKNNRKTYKEHLKYESQMY